MSAAPTPSRPPRTSALEVCTPQGPGRLTLHPPTGDRADGAPRATLLLSHGAGAGVDTVDLVTLATRLPAHGFAVALFEQPWRVAGRRLATAPPTLDVAFTCAAAALAGRTEASGPLVVGGRSAGARSAARTAHSLGAVGCLALAFPLHPPGRPEASRLPELSDAGVPVLVVQGERDPMGRPEEFPTPRPELPDAYDLVVAPGADHSFVVAKRAPLDQAGALDLVVAAVLAWLVRTVPARPTR